MCKVKLKHGKENVGILETEQAKATSQTEKGYAGELTPT